MLVVSVPLLPILRVRISRGQRFRVYVCALWGWRPKFARMLILSYIPSIVLQREADIFRMK